MRSCRLFWSECAVRKADGNAKDNWTETIFNNGIEDGENYGMLSLRFIIKKEELPCANCSNCF